MVTQSPTEKNNNLSQESSDHPYRDTSIPKKRRGYKAHWQMPSEDPYYKEHHKASPRPGHMDANDLFEPDQDLSNEDLG